MTFTEAMNYANGGYKVRRDNWGLKYVWVSDQDRVFLTEGGEKGKEGLYNPSIADINCPDWRLKGKG